MGDLLGTAGVLVLIATLLYVAGRMMWEMLRDGFVPAYVILLAVVLIVSGITLQP